MMHFYGLKPIEIEELPVKTFMFMSSCIDRIMAQKDMRALTIAVSGNAGEAAVDCRNRLIIEAGTVVKMDDEAESKSKPVETLDRIGLAELKRMM